VVFEKEGAAMLIASLILVGIIPAVPESPPVQVAVQEHEVRITRTDGRPIGKRLREHFQDAQEECNDGIGRSVPWDIGHAAFYEGNPVAQSIVVLIVRDCMDAKLNPRR
jgi:hypothetical protein